MRYFEDNVHIMARGEWPVVGELVKTAERIRDWRPWHERITDALFLICIVIGGALLWCWDRIAGIKNRPTVTPEGTER